MTPTPTPRFTETPAQLSTCSENALSTSDLKLNSHGLDIPTIVVTFELESSTFGYLV